MSAALKKPRLGGPEGRTPSVVVKRIRFMPRPPPGAKVVREFRDPRQCAAVEETLDLAAVATGGEPSNACDDLTVALLPADATAEAARLNRDWMVDRNTPHAALTVAGRNQKIAWRPGRAIVQGSPAGLERGLDVLRGFAFYEGELQRLERALDDAEPQALADIVRGHRIRWRDRKHWPRLAEASEQVCKLRLYYAHVAARLAASHRLPPESRELLEQLIEQADVPERLEAASARIEAYENLYQGAVDRIAEYRWYIGGHWLELSIILLLVLEAGVMLAELYLARLR